MFDSDSLEEFWEKHRQLDNLMMDYADQSTQRFFNLDTAVYREGELDSKIKELLGLVGSLVLRCDDCVTYHLVRCYEKDVSTPELREALSIGLIIGGSITIPHLRRAIKTWDELHNLQPSEESNEK